MSTEHWKAPIPINKQTSYDNFSIRGHGLPSANTTIRYKGSFPYWVSSIHRLGVFTDTYISPGVIVNGKIDSRTRDRVRSILTAFLKPYEGKSEDRRPFKLSQEKEMWELINGGFLNG